MPRTAHAASSPLRYVDWTNLRFALEWVYCAHPVQRTQTGHPNYSGLSAWLVRRGSLTISGGGVSVHARVGDWVFPPFKEHHREFSEDLEILSIRFVATWGGDNELFQETAPLRCESTAHPALERAALHLLATAGSKVTAFKTKMMWRPMEIDHYTRIQKAFLSWAHEYISVLQAIGATLRQVKITDDRVRDVKTYLDSVGFDVPVRERALAEKVGLSVAQLNRVFVKDTGFTPMGYFNQRKLSHAKHLLINSAMPVKQIGFELGYSAPANFTNWFRSKAVLSPKLFRRQATGSS